MSNSVPAAPPTEEPVPERFVPDAMRGQLVAAEHVARYTWASAFCSGRRVLDAGCGAGYGSELLNSAGAAEVVAVDSSEAALQLARAAVSPGVTCELGDVTELPYPDDSFDGVVCFEVIEHVEDPERVMDELARVLRPDGLLFISSPNRDRYVPGNPHHIHELVRDELQAMLDARFASARIISQHVMVASVVSWSGSPTFEGALTRRTADPAPEDELYLLAIAGSELPPDPGPVVTLGRFAEPRRWLDHIERQRRHIEEQLHLLADHHDRGADSREALDQLAGAQAKLARLTAQDAELEEIRRELTSAHEKLDRTAEDLAQATEELAEVPSLREQVEAQAAELGVLRTIATSKSWQLTAPLRRVATMRRRL